jgi:endo-1,4-beta-D-glucanase Y
MTKEEDRVNAILKAQEDSDKIYTPEKLSIQIKEKKDEVYDLSKSDQIRILKNLGLSDEEIKELRIEGNRVNKILKLRDKDSKKVDKVIKDQKEYKPTDEEKKSIEIFDLNKDEQIDILKEHDLSDKEIKALKYEKDRVEKILELQED